MANIFPTPPAAVMNALIDIFRTQTDNRMAEILSPCAVRIEEEDSGYGYNDNAVSYNLYIEMPPKLYGEWLPHIGGLEKRIQEVLPGISRGAEGHHWISSASFCVQMHQQGMTITDHSRAIERIWQPGLFRLFISHRSEDRLEMTKLKEELANYGISGFVAHKDIKVHQEWEKEIRHALNSMQGLLAAVTPDFHKSHWTNQEVGFAFGRGILVTSLRIGADPEGFAGIYQAMPGNLDQPQSLALALLDAYLAHDFTSLPMRQALIHSIVHSNSYNITIACFNRLQKLYEINRIEAEQLQKAFDNTQVANCIAVAPKLLQKIQKHFPKFRKAKEDRPLVSEDDEIPF